MRKVLTISVILLVLSANSSNANYSINQEATISEYDCGAHATAVALQAVSYDIHYWEAWFYSYGWCIENLN